MDRQDTAVTLPWLRQGTELLLETVASVDDDQLREPSALTDWTRAHLVAHLARNAEALARLTHWASTGEETPMYPDPEARNLDIERTAGNPAAVLRAELVATAADLDKRLSVMDDDAWSAPVRTAQGRPIPGREIPWMRIREVWLHAVDLDTGVRTTDFPAALTEAFLDDVAGVVGAKPDCPSLVLRSTDSDRTWPLGWDQERSEVSGPTAELLAWVSGRPAEGLAAAGGALPALPPWI
jgi:maleylpyruvate isomerase